MTKVLCFYVFNLKKCGLRNSNKIGLCMCNFSKEYLRDRGKEIFRGIKEERNRQKKKLGLIDGLRQSSKRLKKKEKGNL